jgi:excisionase family DNA binding protein
MARQYTVNTHLDTFSVAEAAELIGVSQKTIYRKAREKAFLYLKPGKEIQIIKRSFMDWWRSTGTGSEV